MCDLFSFCGDSQICNGLVAAGLSASVIGATLCAGWILRAAWRLFTAKAESVEESLEERLARLDVVDAPTAKILRTVFSAHVDQALGEIDDFPARVEEVMNSLREYNPGLLRQLVDSEHVRGIMTEQGVPSDTVNRYFEALSTDNVAENLRNAGITEPIDMPISDGHVVVDDEGNEWQAIMWCPLHDLPHSECSCHLDSDAVHTGMGYCGSKCAHADHVDDCSSDDKEVVVCDNCGKQTCECSESESEPAVEQTEKVEHTEKVEQQTHTEKVEPVEKSPLEEYVEAKPADEIPEALRNHPLFRVVTKNIEIAQCGDPAKREELRMERARAVASLSTANRVTNPVPLTDEQTAVINELARVQLRIEDIEETGGDTQKLYNQREKLRNYLAHLRGDTQSRPMSIPSSALRMPTQTSTLPSIPSSALPALTRSEPVENDDEMDNYMSNYLRDKRGQ